MCRLTDAERVELAVHRAAAAILKSALLTNPEKRIAATALKAFGAELERLNKDDPKLPGLERARES